MNFYIGLLVSFASVTAQLLQPEPYDYCDPELKLCPTHTDHTMCKYPVPGFSDKCTTAVHEPLNANDKKRLLFLHNKFRSNVASGTDRSRKRKLPTASDMRQIYWDKELETIAIRWAEQCVTSSVSDTCRNIKRFKVSQNVGTRQVSGTIDKQITQIIISWLKEGKDFDPVWVDSISEAKDKANQFVNIIRGDTYAVGCARIVFQEQNPGSDQKTTLERLVCNYGPGGSQEEKSIFRRGTPCQNCPEGTQCSGTFPGLCALQNVDRTDPKEDPKTEPETSTQKTNLTLKDSATPSQTTSTEDDSDGFFLEEEDSCSGEDCPAEETAVMDQNQFNIMIKLPKPAARGSGGEKDGKDGKVVSNVAGEASGQKTENGDRCQCYEISSGSDYVTSTVYFLFFCLVLSVFVCI